MKYIRIAFLVSICTSQLSAQTGPAGVDNTVNNGVWLKADKGTSTNIDGEAIEIWEDQSGNGINVEQATVDQQPLFQDAYMNGYPTILFDDINSSGQNDFFSADDAAVLDNSDGFTMFSVVRPLSNNSSARSIMSKRTNVGVNQAYMLFLYGGNELTLDVVTNNNRFDSAPTSFPADNNYIISATFDGSLVSTERAKLFSGQTLIATRTETSASMPDYNSPFVIGATHVGDPRPFDGHIAELIYFRRTLNTTEKIVVDNYLSSKYAISLGTNDFYNGDLPANGDFDHEVAGVGQYELHDFHGVFEPSASGGLGIVTDSIFDDGDYIFIGHDLDTNSGNDTDIDIVDGSPVTQRWNRIWYFDITNTIDDINTTIIFDMSDGGMGDGGAAGIPSNYKLLYRATNSGDWTILTDADEVVDDRISFDYAFSSDGDDGYYTIGTIDFYRSPLPVELLDFSANLRDDQTILNWRTASENDNDYFSIERSPNGKEWEEFDRIKGNGNSSHTINYSTVDKQPFSEISYYRLKQVDFDGAFEISEVRTVFKLNSNLYNIYPNPTSDYLLVELGNNNVNLTIFNSNGQLYEEYFNASGDKWQLNVENYPTGIYYLQIENGLEKTHQKFIVD